MNEVKKGKVVHLTSVHFPLDTRIFYKECVTLQRAGYEVVLVAPHVHSETVDNISIHAVPKPKNRRDRILKTIWQIYWAGLEEQADVYHFHDPELLPIGLLLKMRGKKVIYDIHENLPAQILGKEYLAFVKLRKFIARLAHWSERVALALFDGVVVANPLVAARFPSPKAISLANYPILNLIDRIEPAEVETTKSPVLIYVGGLTPIRGVKEMVRAVGLVKRDVELWLAGPWASEDFRRQCSQLAGWDRVRYLGFLTPKEVYAYLKHADVGMAVLHPQANYLTNLPVKGFEYMACSLPMIMSDFPYWRKVFDGAAVFVDPQDPEAIAEAIQYLIDYPDEAKRLGETGRRLVQEHYSWEAESSKLLALYEQILGN